jgi:ribosomal-protein-serine acetyltransferase
MNQQATSVMPPKTLPTQFRTERLLLRKHRLKLAPKMFAGVDGDRERLRQFLPWVDAIQSSADETAYIRQTWQQWEAGQSFDYGLFRQVDQQYLGNLGVHHIVWAHARCELGYWILGRYERHGYISEAVQGLESLLFSQGFNRIEIRCSSLNLRSAAVPRRLGYVHEGTLRQEFREHGQWRDTLIFARLAQDISSTASP